MENNNQKEEDNLVNLYYAVFFYRKYKNLINVDDNEFFLKYVANLYNITVDELRDFMRTTKTFEEYIESVLKRNIEEFTYREEIILDNTDYFKSCWEDGLSTYKALTFFWDELNTII